MTNAVRSLKSILISGAIALALVVLALPAFASAAPATNPPRTEVTGYVTDATNSNAPLSGASVTVVCNSNTQNDISDGDGAYLVSFLAADCPVGSSITVSAVKDSMSGSSAGTASKVTTKLNVAVIDVAVPELGTVAAISAMAVAGGAFVYSRRRQMQV